MIRAMNMRAQHRPKDLVRLHKQLLESAVSFASRDGIASLSVNAVAREAGVSKGGLLHHFPNKQALIFTLFARLLAIMEEAILDLWLRITSLVVVLPAPVCAICRCRNSRMPGRAISRWCCRRLCRMNRDCDNAVATGCSTNWRKAMR